MKVNILGTIYKIRNAKQGELQDDKVGECDVYTKLILISDLSEYTLGDITNNRKELINQVTRHEIIHAYLFESGLFDSSNSAPAWAINEEMVDWLAIQTPKINKTFELVGCL